MDVLKNSAIIPISASQCGLITRSDAERLVSMLLDRNPPLASLSGFRAKVMKQNLIHLKSISQQNFGTIVTTILDNISFDFLQSSPFSFRVEHSCFGDARGIVLPEAYTSATARCIEVIFQKLTHYSN